MGFYFEYVKKKSEIVQDYFEAMPFVIGNAPQILIDIFGFYLPECDENWFPIWMNKINGYPLYFCIAVEDYIRKEFDSLCVQYAFVPQGLDEEGKIKIIEVTNAEEFKHIFSLAITISCAGQLVMWATNKNIFLKTKSLRLLITLLFKF
ncbi:hypothetical protein [Lysinibacillus sphaericus]|uniref:hypothetical protein n=1 Tax=Lysinibacillus sphaericus TaxID=1421 RepID=UPI003D0377BA